MFIHFLAGFQQAMHPRLLIFNPETDYALASDSEFYTPPKHVVDVRRRLSLLPARYASSSDVIMTLDSIGEHELVTLPYHDLVKQLGIRVYSINEVAASADLRNELVAFRPLPWGWNRRIRRQLDEAFNRELVLPSDVDVSSIRALSHRSTSIRFLEKMRPILDSEIELPVEIRDPQEALAYFERDQRRFFKAPWSSSGRDVMLCDDLETRHVAPWISGVIRSQGSVIMEKAYSKKLDFATEWICRRGKSQFIGYSVFTVSRRGKYRGNISGTQNVLLDMIRSAYPRWSDSVLNAQKTALDEIISPDYSGPVGIDMLVTENGNLNPCVEINLRITMGMTEIEGISEVL